MDKINDDFMQNFTQVKATYEFSQIIEINIKNKLIKNISNSNVKNLLSLTIKRLTLNDCKIQSINKGVFNSMLQLNSLSLNRNEISSIEVDSFLTEPFESHLSELYMSNNKLTKIQRVLFRNLLRLQILCLDNNLIDDVDANSFANMPKLKELHLHSNLLRQIKNEMFLDKSELEILYLYQNNIETIETIPFNTLYALNKLHLFSNKITQIKLGNFIHLVKLDELKLDKNEIGSFEVNTFTGLNSLSKLDLSANKIKKLANGVFYSLKNLKTLDLHLNDITQIESNAFVDLPNLSYLNLDSNKIATLKNIQFGKNLLELYIRYNTLSNLDQVHSVGLKFLCTSNNLIQSIHSISLVPNLENLDLSQNRLIKLEASSFWSLKKLKYLNLSGNKLDLESQFSSVSYFRMQTLLENLDLSFNEIKFLDSNVTFQQLSALKALNLSHNRLRSIESFTFGYLIQLTELNLASNNLSLLNKNSFYGLDTLKTLRLGFNQINSLDFLESNLEFLHLEHNKIEFIRENDFGFSSKLKFLNLNSNPLKTVHVKAFEKLSVLESLKISNTSIDELVLDSSLKSLDLSYLNCSIAKAELLSQIEWINLAKAKTNISFKAFLNNSTKYVDFSFNALDNFDMFNVLGFALETLKLPHTNLQNIEDINLKNLNNLKFIDLSFNNLTIIRPETFESTKLLEYLDLSSNSIHDLSFSEYIDLKKLKYLNLERNKIAKTNEILLDFFSLETFKIASNKLKMYPYFDMSKFTNGEMILEIHLDHNQIETIEYFSFIFGKLNLVNFDSNRIRRIDVDAFLNCRSLEYLSIANNRLENISENNFHFLFSLVYLNLSSNRIDFIEKDSFKNLNKLRSLDLNYNRFYAVDNELFFGLTNLIFLSILNLNELKVYEQSFTHLPQISTIVLNERSIVEYQCLLVKIQDKKVQRSISNKYVFYKSINLLTTPNNTTNISLKCDLVFRFFQFNVHLNLKTDEMFDFFYSSCQASLTQRETNYKHTQKHLRTCDFGDIELYSYADTSDKEKMHGTAENEIFFDPLFWLSLISLLILLVPAFYLIIRYDMFANLCKDSSSNIELMLKELELSIFKSRNEFNKLLKNDLKLKNDYQKSTSILGRVIAEKENDLLKMEVKLQSLKASISNVNVTHKIERI
jgi:Leucine-rich repeat (LRR) protein